MGISMNYLSYKLFEDGYINRLLTVGVFTEDSPYEKSTLQGKINEWLIKGPSVYDNPCRKKVILQRKAAPPPCMDFEGKFSGDEVEAFGQIKRLEVYFPFGNTGVEDSGFYEIPAKLRSYGMTYLEAPAAEKAVLQISTCGALTIWVNDELAADFTPFERNVEHYKEIEVKIKKGLNKLVVCSEDLAERDTCFEYRLRYLGHQDINIKIPVREETDTELIYKAEEAFSRMYFEKEAYVSEDVWLNLKSFDENPVEILLFSEKFAKPRSYVLFPGQEKLLLYHADEIPSGFYYFCLEMKVSGLLMRKVIGTYSCNAKYEDCREASYEKRRQRVLNIIRNASVGNEYRMIVRLHDGEIPEGMEQILLGWLKWVEEKKDCSDFRMIQLAYIYTRFADKMSDTLRRRIEKAMLEYRYWIDEPGDDVMWFFSENHALMFHVSQYFAGKALPDRKFTCSGMSGEEAAQKAERLLEEWFQAFFTESTTEWNSSTYLPIDIMGVAYLYNLTQKGSPLHEKAGRALDMLAYVLAVNEHKGNIMTSFGRTYEKEIKGSRSTGMASLLYLFYNAGHMNEHFRALTPIVIGDYEPPEEYGKYVNLTGGQELIHQNTQGIRQYVNLYLYKNAKALLSTAVGFRPYGPGYQENVAQATLDGTAQVFINHPGESRIYGQGRPGFWVGNGCLPMAVQYRNLCIVEYHIQETGIRGGSCLEYTHAYVPLSEFHSWQISENAAALEKNGGFIGIRALNGIRLQEQGPCRKRELISEGRDNIWILKVGRNGEYQNTAELLEEMEAIQIVMKPGEATRVKDGAGQYCVRNGQLFVNGKSVYHYPLDAAGILEFTGKEE